MNELLKEYLLVLFWYIVPCFGAGLIVLFIRFVIKPKDFIYRKVLHICAICTVFCFILPSHTWWIVLLDIVTILALIDLTLLIIQRFSFYKRLFVDKEKNEIFKMINAYYIVMMIMVAVLYGVRGEESKYLVIVAILTWGVGDAFAAIIGISFGKHQLKFPLVDENKTVEGSLTMLISSLLVSLTMLLIFINYPVWKYIVIPIVLSLGLTYVEAISKKGLDTIFCPLYALAVLFAFSF